MSSDLRALQQRFFALVTAPNAAADPSLVSWLAFEREEHARARAQVYRDAFAVRTFDCLRDDFPNLASLVGASFESLVGDYIARHPSSHPSLRHLGARLAAFAAEHVLSQRWPWLGELAALEWARVEAFDATDVVPLAHGDLARIEIAEWPAHVFAVGPSVRVLTLRFPVERAWRALEDGLPAPEIAAARTEIIVWRRQLSVCHRVMAPREAKALRRAQLGSSFAEVCECFAEEVSVDDAAASALATVAQWIADGVLARDAGDL